MGYHPDYYESIEVDEELGRGSECMRIPLASQGVLRFLIAVIGSNSQIYANKRHLPDMTTVHRSTLGEHNTQPQKSVS
jgi:hypothetical protein